MPADSRNRERLLKVVNRPGSGSARASWAFLALLIVLAAGNFIASSQVGEEGKAGQSPSASSKQNGEPARRG